MKYSFKGMAFGVVSLVMMGCASSHRVLTVRTDPADAEVCVKGRLNSRYFPDNKKHCIGTTPLEADHLEFVDARGHKYKIDLSDLEHDEEDFYIVVSRPGYASQAQSVPSWNHFVALKPEGQAAPATAFANQQPGVYTSPTMAPQSMTYMQQPQAVQAQQPVQQGYPGILMPSAPMMAPSDMTASGSVAAPGTPTGLATAPSVATQPMNPQQLPMMPQDPASAGSVRMPASAEEMVPSVSGPSSATVPGE